MELEDFFNFKDFFRTVLLASALFFIVGTAYGILLHAMFSSQVINVKNDLGDISRAMEDRAEQAYDRANKTMAKEWKEIAKEAEDLSKDINPPAVTPNSYTYFNYWVASAAFTELRIDYEILGMDEDAINAFNILDNDTVFGAKGWWNRSQFSVYSSRTGQVERMLIHKPVLHAFSWTFYIFVFIIGFATAFIVIKEEYEIPTLPEVIYGLFMPLPFFIIYAFTSLLAFFGVGFLHKSQVNVMAVLVSFVTMSIICVIASMLAVFIKNKLKESKA